MFYGRGAGKFPTASAVVADVIDSVRHINANKAYIEWKKAAPDYMLPAEDSENRYFAITNAPKDQTESLFGEIITAYGENGEYAFITDVMKEKKFSEKAAMLGIDKFIRILEA